jgi:hypothetical protein
MADKTPFFMQIVEAIMSHEPLATASKKDDILVFQQENGDICIAWDGDRFNLEPPFSPYDDPDATAYCISGNHAFPATMRGKDEAK